MIETAQPLLSSKVVRSDQIKGGRNSQVYKFECASGESFVGKFYHKSKTDTRDRLGVEYSSLELMWQNGIKCVPQPLINDQKNNCAIYQYIEGANFSGKEITEADLDQVLAFVADLQRVNKKPQASQVQHASEACFSIEEILVNVERRRRRLDGIEHRELKDFLFEFDALWMHLIGWGKQRAEEIGISLKETIPLAERTLSPSDFGFHNAIKKNDGRIVFCDFEYFGWDDPAKLTSDFILHPGMKLSEDLKLYFVRGTQKIFTEQKNFSHRFELVYPLFGMKWCLILLNEFLAQDFSRRIFANDQINQESLLKEQLVKAQKMLTGIKNTYRENPYAK